MLTSFFIVVGVAFGFLAACVAFLITYIEFRHHAYKGWRLWKEALTVGGFTFVFFLCLSILIGYMLR